MSSIFNSLPQGFGQIPSSATTTTGTSNVWMYLTNTNNTTGSYASISQQQTALVQQYQAQALAAHQMQSLQNHKMMSLAQYEAERRNIKIAPGQDMTIRLPDGAKLEVTKDGKYLLEDKDAKIVYKANRVRDFNRFINTSDRIEEFIKFCGDQGVKSEEILQLPLTLFIGWLVLEAAKADKEPEPDIKLLPDLRRRVLPQCPSCGRFIKRKLVQLKVEFCAPQCFENHYNRQIELQTKAQMGLLLIGAS